MIRSAREGTSFCGPLLREMIVTVGRGVPDGVTGEHLRELLDGARLVEGLAVLIGMDRYALWSEEVRESHLDARGQTLDRDPAP